MAPAVTPFDLYSVGAQLETRPERRFSLSFQVDPGFVTTTSSPIFAS